MKQNPVAMPPLDNGNTVPLPLDLYYEPIVVRRHGNDNVHQWTGRCCAGAAAGF
jgi:hypothetical protein